MTQLSSICKALLAGEVLSIMDGFQKFSCTNLPREISRSVEKKFGATISKLPVKFKSQYGHSGIYYQYRLNPRIQGNDLAIMKMSKYIMEVGGNPKKGKITKNK
jgi:hypothetical protein